MKRLGVMLAGLVLLTTGAGADEPMGGFKVIVNSQMNGRKISRDGLAQVYLGKAQRWADGSPITAVDLSSTSPVRAAFSSAVLGMPVDAVQRHWLRILSGTRRPPMIKSTDEDVIAFVASDAGHVGYVAESATLPATVRALTVE